jgi:hypothetical protein
MQRAAVNQKSKYRTEHRALERCIGVRQTHFGKSRIGDEAAGEHERRQMLCQHVGAAL